MTDDVIRLVRHHVAYWDKQIRRARSGKERESCSFFARQCRQELSALQSALAAGPRPLALRNGRFV